MPAGITQAGALTAALTQVAGTASPLETATAIGKFGVPVFPCAVNGKKPLTPRGFHDATINLRQVEQWWTAVPQANIGVPTGAVSGVVVIDVDHGPMVNGYESFDRAYHAGLVSGWEMICLSPSGGMHAYFPATPGVEQRSWQAARAGVDFRGDGGYIIVPPSSRIIGTQRMAYTIQAVNPVDTRTLEAETLRDFLDPRPASTSEGSLAAGEPTNASRLASWVARRKEGERNAGLFWAACRLAENNVPATEALDVLSRAAGEAGLHEREITTTVRSAYRTVHAPRAASSAPEHHERPIGYKQRQAPISTPPISRGL